MVQQEKQDLQNEVIRLEAQIKGQETLNRVLRCAIDCPLFTSLPCLLSSFPPRARELLQELATVEEEIFWLERKVKELKLQLYTERYQCSEWEHHLRRLSEHSQCPSRSGYESMINEQRYRSHNFQVFAKRRITRGRRVSLGSALDIHGLFATSRRSNECKVQGEIPRQCQTQIAMGIEKANELSEGLLKCLIRIFLELNHASSDRKGADASAPKLTLSCMKSTGFTCKTPSFLLNNPIVLSADPYCISSDSECLARDVGPYKDFVHITSGSLHMDRSSQCSPAFGKLRVLINKLCEVDLNLLSNNQKLAFWMNLYNACIMKAILDQGPPTTEDELSALMNKAAMNVGGRLVNAMDIEELIQRQKRDTYGVGYPEANVTFGVCRGTWSSPAVRVYRGEEVGRELERAKAEYLEAAVGVRRRRRKMIVVIVPELLERQMHELADHHTGTPLVEWIYSQLPPSSSLKPPLLQCLRSDNASAIQIQPHRSHFRYLIPPSI